MRKLFLSLMLGLFTLGSVALTPSNADAAPWRRSWAPGYYNSYYYPSYGYTYPVQPYTSYYGSPGYYSYYATPSYYGTWNSPAYSSYYYYPGSYATYYNPGY